MAGAMTAVASLLSMTPDQLGSAVASGQSMSSLATAKGVSSTDLLGAITSGLQESVPQRASAPSSSVLHKIASNIANHAGAVSGSHHRHHGGATSSASSPRPTAADPLASVTSSSSLNVQL